MKISVKLLQEGISLSDNVYLKVSFISNRKGRKLAFVSIEGKKN